MKSKVNGFTLIELVLVILLLSMVSVFMTKIYVQGLRTVQREQSNIDALSQGTLAIERLSRDIREIRSPASLTTMTATQLSFTNVAGTAVTYAFSGSTLTLGGQTLALGVNSLTFGYLDANNATTAVAANVAYITITMQITRNSVNFTFSTAIALREF